MFESALDTQAAWPDYYISVRHFGGLSMVLLQPKDPFGIIREEKGISSRFWASI